MKLKRHRALLLSAIPFVALNADAQPLSDALETFIQHPSQCAIYLGGPDRVADGADRQYGVALAAAMSAFGGPAEATQLLFGLLAALHLEPTSSDSYPRRKADS